MGTAKVLGLPLEITTGALAEACAEAESRYPREACGYLLGPAASPALVDEFRPLENVQDDLHAADPRRHPRTSRNGYAIALADLLTLGDSDGPQLVKAVFHSHPECGAVMSAHDREAALAGGDAPAYPVQHLIVCVRTGRAAHARLFDFDSAVGEFTSVRTYECSEQP